MYDLEEWVDDNYEMTGTDCTTLSGSGDDWLKIADAIESVTSWGAKRCAVEIGLRFFRFYCPRNSHSIDDCEFLSDSEANEFALKIRNVIAFHRPGEFLAGTGI